MTIHIQWQDQHGKWQHYQSKQNQADAYRVAQRRAGVAASSCLRRAAALAGLGLDAVGSDRIMRKTDRL